MVRNVFQRLHLSHAEDEAVSLVASKGSRDIILLYAVWKGSCCHAIQKSMVTPLFFSSRE